MWLETDQWSTSQQVHMQTVFLIFNHLETISHTLLHALSRYCAKETNIIFISSGKNLIMQNIYSFILQCKQLIFGSLYIHFPSRKQIT